MGVGIPGSIDWVRLENLAHSHEATRDTSRTESNRPVVVLEGQPDNRDSNIVSDESSDPVVIVALSRTVRHFSGGKARSRSTPNQITGN